MSDLDKVYSYACQLGSNTPIQLRWEGSGDSGHAAKLLSGLKHMFYPKTTTRIKYHAVINIYEPQTDPIYAKAESVMQFVHGWGTTENQTYELHSDADVTRDSGAFGQKQAHIMFVRNIMPTDGTGKSETTAGDRLLSIHSQALRKRSNSLTEDGGQLRLGMSGAPGLLSAAQQTRLNTPAKNLFNNAKTLVDEAKEGGLTVVGLPNRLGSEDYDEGGVMKNNGVDLGIKKTFYLTFMR
ncbi:MAG TPA: hypothetical protein VFL55_17025 [Acetobacteraceae bacterium]|jgi:hypothetical protein|nr:hypothetical protein [Acetobacteraceae bacterium]